MLKKKEKKKRALYPKTRFNFYLLYCLLYDTSCENCWRKYDISSIWQETKAFLLWNVKSKFCIKHIAMSCDCCKIIAAKETSIWMILFETKVSFKWKWKVLLRNINSKIKLVCFGGKKLNNFHFRWEEKIFPQVHHQQITADEINLVSRCSVSLSTQHSSLHNSCTPPSFSF